MAMPIDELVRALGEAPEVHQAVGMISVQIGASVHEAALRLVAEAEAAGLPVECVAAEVVARRRRFAPES